MFKFLDHGPLRSPEGDGGGGGGGSDDGGGGGKGGDAGSKGKEVDIDAKVAAAVEEATAGLKRKNEAVIEERRKFKTAAEEATKVLEGLGGQEGIERLQKMRTSLESTELGKLLAEGKHDDWHEQKTKALRADHANQLQAKDDANIELQGKYDVVSQRLKRKNLETEVHAACGAAGVIESARSDVMLNADALFNEHPEYQGLVIQDRDEGVVFGKDGKTPKSITEWLAEQKATKRHWFPPSKGADASGNLSGGERETDLGEIRDMRDWREKRKKLGMGTGFGTENI